MFLINLVHWKRANCGYLVSNNTLYRCFISRFETTDFMLISRYNLASVVVLAVVAKSTLMKIRYTVDNSMVLYIGIEQKILGKGNL